MKFQSLILLLTLCLAGVSCRKEANAPEQSSAPAEQPQNERPGTAELPRPPLTTAVPEIASDESPADATRARTQLAPVDRFAYSGYYDLGSNGPKALIEDLVLRQSMFRTNGQEAFGYTVREIQKEWVLLERDGAELKLMFGKKKPPSVPGIDPTNYPPGFVQTAKTLTRPVPAAPPAASQVVQPIAPSQLPPEVQKRLQERLEKEAAGK